MLCRMSEAEARRDIRDSVSLLGASSPAPSQGAAAATIQARLTHSTVVRIQTLYMRVDINSEDF
jgi:hypothetical protein